MTGWIDLIPVVPAGAVVILDSTWSEQGGERGN